MTTPLDALSAKISPSPTPPSPPLSFVSSSVPFASNRVPPNLKTNSDIPPHLDPDPLTDQDDAETAKIVAVPQCSTWFSMDKINPIEKRMLPEFFVENGSKTAELYLKYRNYMVHAYRHQPDVYLTATACRRNLSGDACAILRVHEFLTHWGLINFHVPPHAMPPAIHSNYMLKTVEKTARKEEQGPVAMLVGAAKDKARRVHIPLACEACGTARKDEDSFFELTRLAKKKLTSCGAATNLASTNALTTAANGKASEDMEVTVGGFALRPGSGICEECYIRGAFPEGYDASDFVLMPTVAKNLSAGAKWTEEETNLMIDAVSSTRTSRNTSTENKQDDDGSCDWNYVASKVGSKTAEECLLHFLEMPMLDQSMSTQRTELGDSMQSLQPFTAGSALNAPVLDLVTLVEQVDPLIAKAAAYAAISAIKRLHTMPVTSTTPPLTAGVNGEHLGKKGAAVVKVENTPTSSGPNVASGSSASSFESAVAAVVNSAEVAGIESAVKAENVSADGDVAMDDASGSDGIVESTSEVGNGEKQKAVSVSKETIAVTEEAANATTLALLATRSQTIADDIANGPVRGLVNQLLENQLRQMELKMQQLTVLEQAIVAEKEQVAKEKYELYVDRLSFSREKMNYRSAK